MLYLTQVKVKVKSYQCCKSHIREVMWPNLLPVLQTNQNEGWQCVCVETKKSILVHSSVSEPDTIHPFIHRPDSLSMRRRWSRSQLTQGEGRGPTWTGVRSVTGPPCSVKQPHTLTQHSHLWVGQSRLTWPCVNRGRKLENLQESYLLVATVIVVILLWFLLSCLLIGRVLRFRVTCLRREPRIEVLMEQKPTTNIFLQGKQTCVHSGPVEMKTRVCFLCAAWAGLSIKTPPAEPFIRQSHVRGCRSTIKRLICCLDTSHMHSNL